MSDGRDRSVATLALSLVVFALTLGVSVIGTEQDSLFADPARFESRAPPEAVPGR